MKYNPFSRRMFLQGSGVLLSIPVLESLLPILPSAMAQTTSGRKVRFIQMVNMYGPDNTGWYGSAMQAAAQPVAGFTNVRAVPLTNVTAANLSKILGPSLNPIRNKMSVLRGLDVIYVNGNHQLLYPTCASGYVAGVDDQNRPPLSGQPSMDTIIAASDKVYPSDFPSTRRTLSFGKGPSMSWMTSGTTLGRRPSLATSANILSLYEAGLVQSSTGNTPAPDTKIVDLLNAVFADYSAVKNSTRITASDKAKLDGYLSLLSDLKAEQTPPPAPPSNSSCTNPTITDANDFNNQLKLMGAILACDLTRVVNINLSFVTPSSLPAGTVVDWHAEHHGLNSYVENRGGNAASMLSELQRFASIFAQVVSLLDGIDDNGFTLLDNSIVYWSHQYAVNFYYSGHTNRDMAVLVAGGGGGNLRQGNFINFQKANAGPHLDYGIPFNNLLVTFANCMGLSSSDYEKIAANGYGYYKSGPSADGTSAGDPAKLAQGAFYGSTTGRRSPLPYFYTGANRG